MQPHDLSQQRKAVVVFSFESADYCKRRDSGKGNILLATVSLPQIGTFVAVVDCRYLPECTFLDMLIYWCFKGHMPLYHAMLKISSQVFIDYLSLYLLS